MVSVYIWCGKCTFFMCVKCVDFALMPIVAHKYIGGGGGGGGGVGVRRVLIRYATTLSYPKIWRMISGMQNEGEREEHITYLIFNSITALRCWSVKALPFGYIPLRLRAVIYKYGIPKFTVMVRVYACMCVVVQWGGLFKQYLASSIWLLWCKMRDSRFRYYEGHYIIDATFRFGLQRTWPDRSRTVLLRLWGKIFCDLGTAKGDGRLVLALVCAGPSRWLEGVPLNIGWDARWSAHQRRLEIVVERATEYSRNAQIRGFYIFIGHLGVQNIDLHRWPGGNRSVGGIYIVLCWKMVWCFWIACYENNIWWTELYNFYEN